MAHKVRLQEFDSIVEKDVIDLGILRKYCFQGVPDEGGRRSLAWKLLLAYLPCGRDQWDNVLEHKRTQYNNFVEEMVMESGSISKNSLDNSVFDHPLNTNPNSEWGSFFRDNEVLRQIDRDVRRLCPDMMFFQKPTEYPYQGLTEYPDVERLHQRVTHSSLLSSSLIRKGLGINKMESNRKRITTQDYLPLKNGSEAHWEVVERILFVYAKLNTGQSYVQGMNEIVGPLYYTFATDPLAEVRKFAEADTFWCFTSLMGEMRDFFICTLDESASGIGFMMNRLMDNLRHHDRQLWQKLKHQEIEPQFYSFRWLTLLLSQEFDLPDLIRIWDSLFSDNKQFSHLIQICTAMLILQRSNLLHGDFSDNMKLLQNYPPVDVQSLINKAMKLTEE